MRGPRPSMASENNPMYGKHHTTETRHKISNTRKENPVKLYGENNPMYGKHPTDATRRLMSQVHAGCKWYNNGVKNIQIKNGDDIPEGFIAGMIPLSRETIEKQRAANIGKHWFNNGENEIKSFTCPDGYQKGRLNKINK